MRASNLVLIAGIIGAAMLSSQGEASPVPVSRNDSRNPAPAWRNTTWLNSPSAITLESLKGRVVLLNFWTYACYNCTNTVPALTTLDAKYRSRGLSLLGIHTPEYPPHGGEHDTTNVRKALTRQQITYPNAMDNDRATWRLYGIRYWPSMVLIDKQGRIRHEGYGEVHVGDRRYADWERRIELLLAE